jgi:hypothetical protein
MLLLFGMVFSCNGQKTHEGSYHIKQLEQAENRKSLEALQPLFEEKAVLFTTEIMPIKGRAAIVSIYDYVFSNNNVESVHYKVDETKTSEMDYSEAGVITTKIQGQDEKSQPFTAVFKMQNDRYIITEISFGEEASLKKKLPEMLIPTGNYQIGQTNFFYDRVESENDRLLSFQVWYPAKTSSNKYEPFRTEEVLKSLSGFLGVPPFSISYFSDIKSHSILNAPAIPTKVFPVLFYNHGYGGFTQVYQTVFEELVSHGYIIVSVGHENESALLIKGKGDVVNNSTENPFYAKRAPELSGTEIGRWQSIILSSNKLKDNIEAYKKMLTLTPLHNESTRLWASDTKAVLEKLKKINVEHENLSGIFDLDRLGIFGHSLGGATAGQLGFGITPFKAGINLDGFQFGDLFKNQLEIPFMFVSSNPEDSEAYLHALTFIESARRDCYQVAIKGFYHDNFTDLNYIIGGDKKAMSLQRALILQFFNKYLKSELLDLKNIENTYKNISMHVSMKGQ